MVAIFVGVLTGACPKNVPRPYPAPTAATLVSFLTQVQARARSFVAADTRMDYWRDQRIRATVAVMGQPGAKARFNALNPTGGDVAADLACDGQSFIFVDYNHNCQLTGPCNREAIAQLLQVSMAPDDFFWLAIGSVPLIEHEAATTQWDARDGVEVLTLSGQVGKQQIVLAGAPGQWEVRRSTVWNPEGQEQWRLSNKEFSTLRAPDGSEFRVAARSEFTQPQTHASLLVRWNRREINREIAAESFQMEVPPLPPCQAQPLPQ